MEVNDHHYALTPCGERNTSSNWISYQVDPHPVSRQQLPILLAGLSTTLKLFTTANIITQMTHIRRITPKQHF
jgi:hypothetical protein